MRRLPIVQIACIFAFCSSLHAQLPAKDRPVSVAIFMYDGMELLDFAGPAEVFASSGFDMYGVTADGLPITCNGTGSFLKKLSPDYAVRNAPAVDIIVLPGGASQSSSNDEKVLAWIQKHHASGGITLSVCTGAQILAKTGLLDGLTVTTWYGFIPGLQKILPNSKVVEQTRFVDNGRLLTTAGVSAGIDGALHLVDRIQGREAALATAKYMEYDKWKPEDGLIVDDEIGKWLRQGKIDDAIRRYRQNHNTPLYFGDLLNHATRLSGEGKWTEAKKLADLVVKEFPGEMEGWKMLGQICRELKLECPISEEDFLNVIRNQGTAVARKSFDGARSKFKGWLLFSESAINRLGYQLMAANPADAVEVLKMYAEMYPQSFNAFDSLAEAYWKTGNTKMAVVHYRKSLELNPKNQNAVTMLEKIQASNQ